MMTPWYEHTGMGILVQGFARGPPTAAILRVGADAYGHDQEPPHEGSRMATRPPGFTWQEHPCPPWCELEHHDDDHPDDRVHRGASRHVAATLGPDPHDPQDVLVTLAEQRVGEGVRIALQQAEGPLHLSLTPEGAVLLHDALGHTLRTVSDGASLSPGPSPCPPSCAAGSP